MGSVKNLTVLEKSTENSFGKGVFEFTDDYSVFDYGKMPDMIPGKGEALCRMTAWNFENLTKQLGIATHFRSFIEPNKIEVNIVRVLYPDRDEITTETTNYLIPLEIIFRNSLPQGSSVFRALDSGEITIQDLGLDHKPEPGEKLDKPILDVTTKLEETDRRLKWDEAQRISGLDDEMTEKVKKTTLAINEFLTRRAESINLEHADGKVEFALGPNRELILVDALGTPDENRFLINGFHISKQVLRNYYKKTEWYKNLENSKNVLPKDKWPMPTRISPDLVTSVSDMYKAVCESWTGNKIWNVSLENAIETIRKYC